MFALSDLSKDIHIVQSDVAGILNNGSYSMLCEHYFNILI